MDTATIIILGKYKGRLCLNHIKNDKNNLIHDKRIAYDFHNWIFSEHYLLLQHWQRLEKVKTITGISGKCIYERLSFHREFLNKVWG